MPRRLPLAPIERMAGAPFRAVLHRSARPWPGASLLMAGWEGGSEAGALLRRPRLWAGAVLLAVVTLGAIVGGLSQTLERDPGGGIEVEPDAPPPPGLGRFDPGPDPIPEDGTGAWYRVAVPGSFEASTTAWTGRHVLVVGEATDADGVAAYAYEPSAQEWEALPDPPLVPEAQRAAVWTGEQMVVLERSGPGDDTSSVVYEPGEEAWREASSPPAGPWLLASARWNGERVVLLSEAPAGGSGGAVHYDPQADAWETRSGPDLGEGTVVDMAMLHHQAVALVDDVDASDTPTLAVTAHDPGRDRWSPPAEAPVEGRWQASIVADPGRDRVIVAGPQQRDGSWSMRAASWSPEEGWEELPGAEDPPSGERPLLAATDHSVLAWWVTAGAGARHRIGATRGWQLMTPRVPGHRPGPAAVFAGRRLLLFGPPGDARGEGTGTMWDPLGGAGEPQPGDGLDDPALAGRWREEPVDPEARERPSLAAVDGDVHVLGGLTRAGPPLEDGLVLRPGSSATRRLPEAGEPSGMSPPVAWTGRELLVLSSHRRAGQPVGAGGAYDPDAGTWRELPGWPHEGAASPVSAWTGEELLVVAGEGAVEAAAAYHPQTDSWRALAPPQAQGHPIHAVWTDGVLAVMVRNPPELSVLTYDPEADVWSDGPAAPLTVRGGRPVVAWTGDEVLVWGGLGTAGSGAAYDPAGNTWRRVPDAPVVTPATAVGAWTGEHLIVLGMGSDRSVGAAAFDPDADRWLALPEADRPLQGLGPAVWTGEELLLWNPRGRPHTFTPGS